MAGEEEEEAQRPPHIHLRHVQPEQRHHQHDNQYPVEVISKYCPLSCLNDKAVNRQIPMLSSTTK